MMYMDVEFFILKIVNDYLVVLYAIFGLFIIYKYRKKRLLDSVVLITSTLGVSEFLKSIFQVPRPIPLRPDIIFHDNSMPSTHTALAFAIFFMLYIFINEKHLVKTRYQLILGISLILAVVIAMLRVLSNAHTIWDVAGGIIVAGLISLLFKYYDISGRRV